MDQFGILQLPRCKVARQGYPANFGVQVLYFRTVFDGHLVPELILDQLWMFRMHLINYHVGNLGDENQEEISQELRKLANTSYLESQV